MEIMDVIEHEYRLELFFAMYVTSEKDYARLP